MRIEFMFPFCGAIVAVQGAGAIKFKTVINHAFFIGILHVSLRQLQRNRTGLKQAVNPVEQLII